MYRNLGQFSRGGSSAPTNMVQHSAADAYDEYADLERQSVEGSQHRPQDRPATHAHQGQQTNPRRPGNWNRPSSQVQPVNQGGPDSQHQPAHRASPATQGQPPHQQAPVHSDAQRLSKYPEFFSIKVHGGKSALNFVPDITRKNFHTVALEAAEMLNQAARTYNWQNKSRVQLTRGEFLEVVAVLLGLGAICECKYDNHGPQGGPKKGFSLKHQGKSVFVTVFEADKPPRAVPIPLMEALQIAHMMLSVYVENYPGLTPDSVISSLSMAVRRRDAAQGQSQRT